MCDRGGCVEGVDYEDAGKGEGGVEGEGCCAVSGGLGVVPCLFGVVGGGRKGGGGGIYVVGVGDGGSEERLVGY